MSFQVELARFFARIGKADKKMALNLEVPARKTETLASDHFTKKLRVKSWKVDGFSGMTINGSYPKHTHILMLPGGGYTLEPSKRYKDFAEYFAIEEHAKVSILTYPLSPEYTALAVHQYLMNSYIRLLEEYPADEFFLFGDFSGGGLALSFLQEIRDLGNLPLPVRTAVISPWLDITLENPKIKIVKKSDPFLPVEGLKEAGKRYRGNLEPDHPFVSPIHGDWNHLGKILMFSGTDEIMTPDCELLAEKSSKLEETEIIYKKGANMIHDWILIPCKETDATLDMVSTFFMEDSTVFK